MLYGGRSVRNSEINGNIHDFTVEKNNQSLYMLNGVYYFNQEPFSGYITSHYANGVIEEKSGYRNGKQEGISLTWFENGVMQSKRYYVKGEKNDTHYGWYEDGSKRFEYNFNKGINSGIHTEWYQNGSIAKKTTYSNGSEESVQAWRDNGKLYINYVVKDGVIYGMNNSHLCYTLENEKGVYATKK